MQGDAADDGAGLAGAVVEGEFQQLVGLGNFLAGSDRGNADIALAESVEVDIGLLGSGFPGLETVFLLDAFEAFGLGGDGLVIDFLEEQSGRCDSRSCRNDLGAAELCRAELG